MIKDGVAIKEGIIEVLKQKGPGLPIPIAKATEQPTLFASAFLSELYSEKRVRISNMKVGGSPLYFLPGQESMLENFQDYLKGKEKEAFLFLKERKILEHEKLDPAIRTALANLRDFAFPFKYNERVYWKYYTFPDEEAIEDVKKRYVEKQRIEENTLAKEIQVIQEPKQIQLEEPLKIQPPAIPERLEIEKPKLIPEKEKLKLHEEKPLIRIKEKKEKPREKSDFVVKVVNYLTNEDIELIEEKEFKKKEFYGICRVDTHLGKIEFLIIAKDKKKVSESDLTIATQYSNNYKMPVLIVSTGDMDKKALIYLEKYKNLVKFRKI